MHRSKKNYSKRRSGAAFWLILAALTLVLVVSVSGVALAAGSASGIVFRDYDASGTQNGTEPGVGSVTINAYGAAGTIVGTATSSAAQATLGQYTISWTGPDTRVRLEFSGLPGTEQQGAFGSGSGTSVQFVDAGATGVNYGINRPSDYCLASPNLQLITTCFQLGAQSSGNHSVISHAYTAPAATTDLATDIQVGPVWGVAYKRPSTAAPNGTVFVSAFAKRQAEYGPGGAGQIYSITGGVVSPFAVIPNAGTTVHTADPVGIPYAQDSTFYDAPGKESLGDMDISEDGSTLWIINLNDRQLYSVDSTSGAVQARGVIGSPTCAGGVYRPFGLGIRDGLVYVGGVCTNENSPLGTTAGLQAYVFTFNPATNAVAQVLTFPLNYPRGCADIFGGYLVDGAPLICRTGTQGSSADWQPWTNTWPSPNLSVANGGSGTGLSGNLADPADQKFFAYAQPMVAGIEFVNDDMVISLRDRMGDQIGYEDNGPDDLGGLFPDTLITVTAGDILRASPNGAGGWTVESNAQSVPAGTFGPSGGAGNEQGPGNGEYYFGDNFSTFHDETITGGIVQVPGAPEIATSAMDPSAQFSAGTVWYDNTSGTNTRNFTTVVPLAPFGKGNGLGDLTALCAAAPVEIGNYVWFDADQDGIQDPTEQPLPNIIVTLTDNLGNPILVGGNPVSAITDAQGRYIFSSNTAGTTTVNFIYSVPLADNTTYQVRIDTNQPNLVGYSISTPNVGGGANSVRDSNGVPTGSLSIATVTTGTAGQNNHTIDFGFFTPSYSLGNRVWFDNGSGGGTADNGIQDGTEAGIDGVTVNLLDNLGNVIATTVTAGGGYYRFDNLLPGSYTVEIAASNFTPGGVLAGLNSSTDAPTSGTPNNDIDRDDNGVSAVGGAIRSNPIQLGPPGPSEPTGTTDLGPGDSTLLPTGRSNLTVDFGFFGVSTNYSLGNRVWLDSNNNGLIDAGEIGIGSVVLNLYTVNGGVPSPTPLRTTSTDSSGYYLFDNLPAGDYIVEVAASNCSTGGPLNGLTNSTGAGQELDPNLDGDNNDNGLDSTGTCGVRSGVVTLGPGTSEPTGEIDLGPQGSGIASNDRSNLTVDFGYYGTPQTPGGTTPSPVRLDPAIVKLVDPAFALPGEDVRWTIVVTNPHSVAINNVSFVDTFPSQLEIISTSADNTVGSLVVTGNTVSYSIVVINPGQSVRVNVLTRIRPGTPVPFIITNTVNLTGAYVGSASATVLSVGSLPATGFEPVWRKPLLISVGAAVLAVSVSVGAWYIRRPKGS